MNFGEIDLRVTAQHDNIRLWFDSSFQVTHTSFGGTEAIFFKPEKQKLRIKSVCKGNKKGEERN